MAELKDTLLRQLAMLSLMPEAPRFTSTSILRDMEASTALALTLAEEHLQNLLPQSVLALMAPQFGKAKHYLDILEQNKLAD